MASINSRARFFHASNSSRSLAAADRNVVAVSSTVVNAARVNRRVDYKALYEAAQAKTDANDDARYQAELSHATGPERYC